MAFCTTCGSEKPDNGPCPVCQPAAAAPPPPPMQAPPPPPMQAPPPPQYQQAPPPQYGQAPQPQYGQPQYAQPRQQSPLVADAMNTIKKFFSPDPMEATRYAITSRVHSWVILAIISVVVLAFAVMFLPAGIISTADMSTAYTKQAVEWFYEHVMSQISLFGYGALIAAISFFLLACLSKVAFQVSKVNAPFATVLNLTAAALLPTTLAGILGIVFALFYFNASVFIMIAGTVLSIVLLYSGMMQSAQFQKSPFWVFLGGYVAYAVIMYFIIRQFIPDVAEGLLGAVTQAFIKS